MLRRDPTQDGITAFFRRFEAALEQRGLDRRGITTDGASVRYTQPASVVDDLDIFDDGSCRSITRAPDGGVTA